MEAIAFVLGVFLLTLAFWDLFETVVVPRPTPGWFRIGRYLVRGSWRVLRTLRDGRLGTVVTTRSWACSPPRSTIALLAAWLVTLIVGYGLVLYALRDELRPVPTDLGQRAVLRGDLRPDARVRGHRRGGDGGPRHRHGRRDQRARRGRARRDVPVLAVRVVPAPRAARRDAPGVGGRPTVRRRAPRDLRAAPPRRSAARPVPGLAGVGGRGPRLARRVPAPRVLPLEPRQPVVDQRARARSSMRRASSSRRSRASRAATPSCSSGWGRTSSRTSPTSGSQRHADGRSTGRRSRRPATGWSSPATASRRATTRGRAFEAARATYSARLERHGLLLGDAGDAVAGRPRGPPAAAPPDPGSLRPGAGRWRPVAGRAVREPTRQGPRRRSAGPPPRPRRSPSPRSSHARRRAGARASRRPVPTRRG